MAGPDRHPPSFYLGSVLNIRETLFSKPACSDVFRKMFESIPGDGSTFDDSKMIEFGVRRQSLPVFVRCMTFMGLTPCQGGYRRVPPRIADVHSAGYAIAYFNPLFEEYGAMDDRALSLAILTSLKFQIAEAELSALVPMVALFRKEYMIEKDGPNELLRLFRMMEKLETATMAYPKLPDAKTLDVHCCFITDMDEVKQRVLFRDWIENKIAPELKWSGHPGMFYRLFRHLGRSSAGKMRYPVEFDTEDIIRIIRLTSYYTSVATRHDAFQEEDKELPPFGETVEEAFQTLLENHLEGLKYQHGGIPLRVRECIVNLPPLWNEELTSLEKKIESLLPKAE